MRSTGPISKYAQQPSIALIGGYKKQAAPKKKKPARYVGVKKTNSKRYKVPKTPKVSGYGWGG